MCRHLVRRGRGWPDPRRGEGGGGGGELGEGGEDSGAGGTGGGGVSERERVVLAAARLPDASILLSKSTSCFV